jgi:hypothetical protein
MTNAYIGYIASALVLCTSLTRTMMPLRLVALASNVAFITYGGLLHLYPTIQPSVLPRNTELPRDYARIVPAAWGLSF